ncbi:MAG: LysR family transcriptional regulator [Bacteroidota bacterium]
MNISQQQILYILTLNEFKNFGKAAEVCFVTQPTLSMQIKKAEESLGFQIFNRKRNPLELTVYGKKLIPIISDMQAEYKKISRLSQENQGKIVEEIKIGIIPTVATYLVPKLFENKNLFSKNVKWAIIELKSEDLLEQIRLKKIDFGIMAGPLLEENLMITSLYNEEILIYTKNTKSKNNISTEDLKTSHPWLLNSGNCLRTQMMHFCQIEKEQENDWNYEGGNLHMLLQMVDNHGGYTLIPEFYFKQYKINSKNIAHAVTENQRFHPARNIISVSTLKNSKHPDLISLIHFIKKEFANTELKKYDILSWK